MRTAEKELSLYNKQFADITFRVIRPEKLPHYAILCADIEYQTKAGEWIEIEGIHHRASYDLDAHIKATGKNQYTHGVTPHIIEVATGIDRLVFMTLSTAYKTVEKRVYLDFPKGLEPVTHAILPLTPAETTPATRVHEHIRHSMLDTKGSIGKRYARHDRIGTRYCITIDKHYHKHDTFTIRDRNTTEQRTGGIATKDDGILKSEMQSSEQIEYGMFLRL